MISTVSAEGASRLDAVYWGEQVRQPVRFHEAIRKALNEGYDTFIEVGPHPVLLPAIAQTIDDHEKRDERANKPLLVASIRRATPEREAMLEALGSLYAAGYRVDWEKQYTTPGRVIDLPSYPWQHESYWTNLTQETRHGTTRACIAPLLDHHIRPADEPGKHLFELSIDLKNPRFTFIADRKLMGDMSFPPTAFLELVWEGAVQAYGEGVQALGEIRFEGTLPLAEDAPMLLQLLLRQESETLIRFRVFSRAAGESNGPFAEHVRGVVRLGEKSLPLDAVPTLSELKERCKHPIELQTGQRETLTKLHAPQGTPANRLLFWIHPLALDASFGAVAGGDEDQMAPESLDHLIISRPSTTAVWQYIHWSASAGSGVTLTDVWLLDEQGNALVQAKGLALKSTYRSLPSNSLDQYLYEVVWREAPRRTAKPPGDGSWLLLSDQGGGGDELRSKLESYGRQVISLRAGEAFVQQDATHFVCDPDRAEDFDKVLAATHPDRSPSVVVHLWSLDVPRTPDTREADLQNAQRLGCLSAMHLIQALSRRGWDQLPTLLLITQGAQPVNTPITSIAQAPLWGFGASLSREMPDLRITLIDLDPDSVPMDHLFEELGQLSDEDRVALRGKTRWVARLVPMGTRATAGPSVRPDRTYLITGGFGGLGLVTAQRLVDLGARHLVLMGRSGPTAEARSQIARLEAAGAEVAVALADVSSKEELALAVQDFEVHMPPLGGVVHAAGVLDDGVVLNLTAERFRAVAAPKVFGAWNLHDWCKDKQLDFFVLFSSIAGVLGSPGQAHYAAGNAFQDALALARTSSGLIAQTVDWGGWGETGMATRMPDHLRHTMGNLMSNVLGADLFERILAYSGAPQITAVGFRSAQWRKFERGGTLPPLLRELASSSSRPRTGWVREELTNRPAAQRKQNVEDYIRNVVAISLGVRSETLHRDTPFEELGLDSLRLMTLRRRIQSDLRVAVPISILDRRCSVATLSSWAMRELTAEWPERSSPPTSTLIELHAGGARPPLWLVHAVSGNAAIYQPLASALGRCVWGIENLIPNDSTLCPDSIEDIAERYVEMLVHQDSAGPYLIGGWSFGGCVALEVAQGLRRRGSDVPLVVLMDAYHPSLSSTAEGRAMMARTLLLGNLAEEVSSSALKDTDLRSRVLAAQLLITDLSHQPGVNPPARLLAREALETAVRFAAQGAADFEKRLLTELGAAGILGTIEMDEVRRLLATYRANVVALSEYRPKYYDGTVLLVRAASAPVPIADAGWRDAVKDLQVRSTDGDHFSVMRPPHVARIAELISGSIDDALIRYSREPGGPRIGEKSVVSSERRSSEATERPGFLRR